DLSGKEIDFDVRYGVAETVQPPYDDDLGGGSLLVPVTASGTYPFQAAGGNGVIEVRGIDHPFDVASDAGANEAAGKRRLRVEPNPFSQVLHVHVPDWERLATARGGDRATLEIYDVSGRLVRRIPGSLRAGFAWDGRDTGARPLPAGVYLQRLTDGPYTLRAKALLL